jgi:uncharacterized protein YndB with AHSA1/START domain
MAAYIEQAVKRLPILTRSTEMADIRHGVRIVAPQARVYEALTTIDGLASWWTRTVEGDADQGGKISFYFGQPEPGAVMEVIEADAPSRVVWRCVEGAAEWIDTTLIFELSQADGETLLMFTHADWREPVPFMHHCSSRWGYFLLSLKAGLEGRTATPFPDDLKF